MQGERVIERLGDTACLELSLLGGFHLRCWGEPVAPPSSVQRLLALLALHDRPLARRYIAGTLWLDSSEHHASGDLRSALWRLRKTDPSLVDNQADRIGLGRSVRVDVHHMIHSSHRLQTNHPVDNVDEELFTQDLLPDWYEDWLLLERERLHQMRLVALETLACRLINQCDYAGAVRAALAAVHCESMRESSHRVLIRAHMAEGNYSEAIRQYQLYEQLLDNELGLQPSPLMQDLIAPLIRR